ncbi:MAG: signal protein [Terriglobia bacterium]
MTLVPGTLPAFQAKSATKATTAAPAAVAPSDQDIADAKAKGLVWVNTNSKVYHKDGEFYGKTKRGKFMTEADAQKGGNHEAKPSPTSRKSTTKK